MLTVFNANKAAQAFYELLGYVLDETSPQATDVLGEHNYEILSKELNSAPLSSQIAMVATA